MLVVHVAEKPSIAESLARILSGGRFQSFRKRLPVYQVRAANTDDLFSFGLRGSHTASHLCKSLFEIKFEGFL